LHVKPCRDVQGNGKHLPTLNVDDLIGRTFLKPKDEHGERLRARILRKVVELDETHREQEDQLKFLLDIGNGRFQEIVSYNEILSYLEQQDRESMEFDNGTLWKFRAITAHQGPLAPGDHDWKGSTYNVQVEWETGEITYEPLSLMAKDDPVTCAAYAKENNLLDTPGWKRFKHLAKNSKKLLRAINQTKLHSVRRTAKFKFGYQVAWDYKDAMALDAKHQNSKWADSIDKELTQIDDYKTFTTHAKAILDGN
jgi:hypothetical protein